MVQWILIGAVALLLLGWVFLAWQNWRRTTQFTEDDERYDQRVASLNDRQANRLSDDQLTNPASDEDAWELMVRRGERQRERERRPTRRRSPR